MSRTDLRSPGRDNDAKPILGETILIGFDGGTPCMQVAALLPRSRRRRGTAFSFYLVLAGGIVLALASLAVFA